MSTQLFPGLSTASNAKYTANNIDYVLVNTEQAKSLGRQHCAKQHDDTHRKAKEPEKI